MLHTAWPLRASKALLPAEARSCVAYVRPLSASGWAGGKASRVSAERFLKQHVWHMLQAAMVTLTSPSNRQGPSPAGRSARGVRYHLLRLEGVITILESALCLVPLEHFGRLSFKGGGCFHWLFMNFRLHLRLFYLLSMVVIYCGYQNQYWLMQDFSITFTFVRDLEGWNNPFGKGNRVSAQ